MTKYLLVIFLFTIPIFFRIVRPGYFPSQDDFQVIRLLQMDKCFKDGQLPCRWVPDMGFGYGYPEFNYYAPAPYYIMELFHLSGLSLLASVKLFMILITLMAAFGMYLLSKHLWKSDLGAFLSSFLYIYMPFRAVDIYVRGAVPELAAMAIIPFIFLFVSKTLEGKHRASFWLALSLAFLFLSHNVSTLIVTPFVLLWSLFLFLKDKKKKDFKKLFLSTAVAFGLSAFFIIPAWVEKNYVHIDTLTSGYFNYLAHFVSLKQLLFSYNWGYGGSELGTKDNISLAVGIPHWISAFLVVCLVLISKNYKKLLNIMFLFILGWGALFLVHEKSTFIWQNISILSFIQFPWRFLFISGFFFSLVAGAIGVLQQQLLKKFFFVLTILVTFLLYQSFFQPKQWQQITDSEKLSGDSWTKQITASLYDYLPIWAHSAPDFEAPKLPSFVKGEGEVISGAKKTNSQNWSIDVMSEAAELEFPLYYFPNWKAFSDQEELTVTHNNEHGLVSVALERGIHNISLELENTWVRSLSNIISLISVFILFAIAIL